LQFTFSKSSAAFVPSTPFAPVEQAMSSMSLESKQPAMSSNTLQPALSTNDTMPAISFDAKMPAVTMVIDAKPSVVSLPTEVKLKDEQKKDELKSEVVAKKEEVSISTPFHTDEFDNEELGKEHLNIVFIGHVDAGKSTMGGHLLFLTGMVDKRTMDKYEREAKELGRESWYLSWALDLNTEERAKGKTTHVLGNKRKDN